MSTIRSWRIISKKYDEFRTGRRAASSMQDDHVRQSESEKFRCVDAPCNSLSPKNVESRPQTAKTSGDRHKILPFSDAVRLSPRIYPVLCPAAVSSTVFSSTSWMQTSQILKETVSQSVSPSEELSCSFPIRTSPPLFPFFTGDKESMEARIQ